MARTYRTLSLSLPPEVFGQLEDRGRSEGKTAARIAAAAVLREVGTTQPREATSDALVQTRLPARIARWVNAQAKAAGLSTAGWLRSYLIREGQKTAVTRAEEQAMEDFRRWGRAYFDKRGRRSS